MVGGGILESRSGWRGGRRLRAGGYPAGEGLAAPCSPQLNHHSVEGSELLR